MQAEPIIHWPEPIVQYAGFLAEFLAVGAVGFRYAAVRGRLGNDSASGERPFYADACARAAAIGLLGAVVQAVLAQGMTVEMMAPIAAFIAQTGGEPHRGLARLSPEQVFVLSRGLMGAIRAAVLEEQAFLRSPAFEDELVRLVLSYLSAIPAA